MSNPTISVWVTCYNKSEYLKEAIDSILCQTFKPSEILISNDNSTDDTKQILDEYSQNYPDLIKVYHQSENIGTTKNKNFVLSKCTGEYITWLDGDDRFHQKKLELEINHLLQFPNSKIIFSDVDEINENGEFIKQFYHKYGFEEFGLQISGPTIITILDTHIYDILNIVSHQRNELIHRSVVEEVGLFDENIVFWQDYDYRVRQFQKFESVYLPQALQDYRKYDNQQSKSSNEKNFNDITYMYNKYNKNEKFKKYDEIWNSLMRHFKCKM